MPDSASEVEIIVPEHLTSNNGESKKLYSFLQTLCQCSNCQADLLGEVLVNMLCDIAEDEPELAQKMYTTFLRKTSDFLSTHSPQVLKALQ